jgi:hypothetical protein
MDISHPESGQSHRESFDRVGVFLPAGDGPLAPLKAGGNGCSVAGCHCPYFVGTEKEYICENCGHNYSMHW